MSAATLHVRPCPSPQPPDKAVKRALNANSAVSELTAKRSRVSDGPALVSKGPLSSTTGGDKAQTGFPDLTMSSDEEMDDYFDDEDYGEVDVDDLDTGESLIGSRHFSALRVCSRESTKLTRSDDESVSEPDVYDALSPTVEGESPIVMQMISAFANASRGSREEAV